MKGIWFISNSILFYNIKSFLLRHFNKGKEGGWKDNVSFYLTTKHLISLFLSIGMFERFYTRGTMGIRISRVA